MAGTTTVQWSLIGADVSPRRGGVYFARLEGLGKIAITRIVVLGR